MGLPDNIQRMIYERMTLETMPGGLRVENRYKKELSDTLSVLSFRWDMRHFCWNVVCHPRDKMPYIIFKVVNEYGGYRPVGSDTIEQVKRSIWWSRVGIARQARKMEEAERYRNEGLRRADKDRNRDYAKEMAYPVMNVMNGNGEGNTQSNYMFAGHGESKINA